MSLNPLGTLCRTIDSNGKECYRFRRGADALPSVGDNVLLPTQEQLRSIIEELRSVPVLWLEMLM